MQQAPDQESLDSIAASSFVGRIDGWLSVVEGATADDEVTIRVTGEIDRDNASRLRDLLVRPVERTAGNGSSMSGQVRTSAG